MKRKNIRNIALATLIVIPTLVLAGTFWKSGKISRIITDSSTSYGKCMIKVPFAETSGCQASWISLDCEGKYSNKGDGDRMLNLALIAQNMDKKVSVKIDSSKKFGNYCVATRLDILN